ncbi:hypothetical protein ANCCAN_27500 [Ancylostoma caninum]|uniref:Phosphoglycerate mutase family protein n=1 Tax=Ancylostoma caninum TaxID=29170 RepID=A0A368F3W4_ANCCA|nr:hypothetical protein ANCCAN_27500 [Ancylostoma caninum]
MSKREKKSKSKKEKSKREKKSKKEKSWRLRKSKSKSEKSKSRKSKKSQREKRKWFKFGKSGSTASSTATTDIEPGVMVCSYWPRATRKKQGGRMIVIMRSAERVDRIFGPDWTTTEAPNGYLTPTDLNIPHNTAAKKLLYGKAFEDNPPISAFGKYCAQLSARALCNRGIQPELVVCSPTLRSVQTGEALARFLKTKIAIEPGLLEPLSWYRTGDKPFPEFNLDLLAKLYPIDQS